jgi:hypothetical protein
MIKQLIKVTEVQVGDVIMDDDEPKRVEDVVINQDEAEDQVGLWLGVHHGAALYDLDEWINVWR